MAFERTAPARSFSSYRRQRNHPGFYAATMDAHLPFESWQERDTALKPDFQSDVVSLAAQPFWLSCPGKDRARSHAPDFFARTADGTGVVVDCGPAERVRPRDGEVFAATERVCAEVGWQYRLVTGHDPTRLANLRWLAGYRHQPRASSAAVATATDLKSAGSPLGGRNVAAECRLLV